MIHAVVLATTLSALSPAGIEDAAARTVALAYERSGRRTPARDPSLSAAARALAADALQTRAQAAAELVPLTEAVSFADGWDPSPRVLVVKGSPIDEPLRLLEKRHDLDEAAASHLGVGAATRGDASAVVILLSQRRAKLEPFGRRYDRPVPPRTLCGTLESPLALPEVYVTVPSGTVEKPLLTRVSGPGFCARVMLPVEGRYTVEVLGRGPRGPEVAALFFVDVGPAARRAEGSVAPEPQDAAAARKAILDRINALRKVHGTSPLRLDDQVNAVAQAYSERMAKEQFFSHVSPEGTSVGQRLRSAGVLHQSAGENLGTAGGPLAAHFGIEHSPGHRANVLDARWSLAGIGIATQHLDGRTQYLLTEVFVEPARASLDPLNEAYSAIAQRRLDLKLPALRRNSALEKLATEHARRALAMDEPKVELVDDRLHQRVFEAVEEAAGAAVDSFVSETPVPPVDSRALGDSRNAWVGVGMVKGDSPRFGNGRYWVVVIYATAR
jgi:uncharacterized protein YkwD